MSMKYLRLLAATAVFGIFSATFSSCAADAPKNPDQMSPAKVSIDVAAIDRDRILKAAAVAMKMEPVTITASTAKLSEGGTNDFYSNGDYWWPNPDTTNGLPYVQRDGQTNPNNFNDHRKCIWALKDNVAALGAAYKITGDDHYAKKAAQLLRVFFLNADTRMNPNLQYAQAVPGVASGRGTGIIDTLHLCEIPKAVEAMQNSKAFPPDVLAGLKKWFADYTDWMLTSKNGHDEANAGNNHAVAFWLQVAVFSDFTGNETNLAECRRRFEEVFIPKQMTNDGSFPRELGRTKPYGYSTFQLDNMVTLCQVLSTPQNDLWNFMLDDGRNIHKGMEFMFPFWQDKSKWPKKPDVNAWDAWPARQPSLLFAGLAFNEQKYLDLWKKLNPDPTNEEVRRNIAITQPVLWVK
jgi:Alginate lyase